ncbi:hypothetical protein AB0O91_39790 [Kitasatospora sp. NPDC089797]|uniref:hypothetical protein n=1 Tax=Kitasatospora sp. NPDC089797 TaxID=3155298 RepID=UPI003447B5F3
MRGAGYHLLTRLLTDAGHTPEQAAAAIARAEFDVLDWTVSVAEGNYGPNGERAGVTPAQAAALTTATQPNGVFTDLSIAEDALRSALEKSQDALRTFGQPDGPAFEDIGIDVDVIRNGQRLTSLGKVYLAGGNVNDVVDAGTRVRVRLLKSNKHNGKKWIVGSIFPLAPGVQ